MYNTLGLSLYFFTRCWSLAEVMSGHGDVLNPSGNLEQVLSQGTVATSVIFSSGLVYLIIFFRAVAGYCLFEGRYGRGKLGRFPPLSTDRAAFVRALSSGSLFILVAYRFTSRSIWCLTGRTEASISRAAVGEVLNAAKTVISALLCIFSTWHFLLFHNVGQAYSIFGATPDR